MQKGGLVNPILRHYAGYLNEVSGVATPVPLCKLVNSMTKLVC
jgi:hypothetical protein